MHVLVPAVLYSPNICWAPNVSASGPTCVHLVLYMGVTDMVVKRGDSQKPNKGINENVTMGPADTETQWGNLWHQHSMPRTLHFQYSFLILFWKCSRRWPVAWTPATHVGPIWSSGLWASVCRSTRHWGVNQCAQSISISLCVSYSHLVIQGPVVIWA